MTGWDVTRALRQESTTDQAYMIALSGYDLEQDRLRSLASGFDRHLVKPEPEDHLGMLGPAVRPNYRQRLPP
jgi:CheY-like chemotaxis protein